MNYLSNATRFASLSNFNAVNNTTGGVLIFINIQSNKNSTFFL